MCCGPCRGSASRSWTGWSARALRMAATRPGVAATFGPAVGVTSLGMFTRGWGWAIPVAPLTLITTVGGIVERPVVRDGRIVARSMLPLTLSFDHAVIDGAPAARFSETLRSVIETAAAFEKAPLATSQRHAVDPPPDPSPPSPPRRRRGADRHGHARSR